MRTLVFILSSFLNIVIGFSQSIYFDAVELRKLDPIPNPDGILQFQLKYSTEANIILGKYIEGDVTPLEIHNKFSQNPFLRAFYNTNQSILSGISADKLKNIGNLPVTSFTDGLARFMVKRMKEELSVMFFEQFQRELEKQRDLQDLFPSTYSILETAKKEIYNYQKFLPALREAFAFDIKEILGNSYEWSISDKTDKPILTELVKKEKAHNGIKILFFAANELDNGNHPGEVISKIKGEKMIDFEKVYPNLLAYFKVLDLFSQSLRSNSTDRYWITKEEATKFQDDVFLKIYLGLIYQTETKKKEDDQITFAKLGKFSSILKTYSNKIDEIRSFVGPLAQEIALTQNRVSSIIQNEANVKTSDYYNLFENIQKMAELAVNASVLGDGINNEDLKIAKTYTTQTSFLYANIKSKAYNAAIYNAFAIINNVIEENSNSGEVNKGLEQFLKYGTFMATVANSESSEEIAAAIEAVALPSGSARIKREAAWNISLNSYLGGFYGVERLHLEVNDKNSVAGIFAPVGLAFSKNFSMARNGRWNFASSLFASIVDIGALASFRLNDENEDISTLPEIKLENIISPGLYAIIGLPRIPLSVGGGYQVGPVLREVSANNLTLGNKSNRWCIFVAVDIPIFNFWTVSRRMISIKK